MNEHPAAAAYLLHQQGLSGLRETLVNPKREITSVLEKNLRNVDAGNKIKTNKQFVDFWVDRLSKVKTFVSP